ncbi:MAG TPA: hypothetical protein VGO91_12850 [Pyrinomonadaceae bacterium]|jgi:hypothetical protein|nr:hypothetical protein [Pyrinomonadaceae bacterium]
MTLISLLLALSLWSNYSIRAERHALAAPATLPPDQSAPVSVGETNATPSYQQYTEYSFYNEQGTWKRSWLQCDRRRNVGLMLDASDSKTQHYLTFKKSQPAQKKVTEFALSKEEDCAMQKCWWAFTSPAWTGKNYAVEESHYIEPDDGYWTRSYYIGTGASEQSAESHVQPCRWFSRSRAAVITERRSMYITETQTGRLVLKVYDHKDASNQPSLFLVGGHSSLNTAGDVESFTFKNHGFTYIINVGAQENHPLAEVLVMQHNAVIFKDDPLSYNYLKKS